MRKILPIVHFHNRKMLCTSPLACVGVRYKTTSPYNFDFLQPSIQLSFSSRMVFLFFLAKEKEEEQNGFASWVAFFSLMRMREFINAHKHTYKHLKYNSLQVNKVFFFCSVKAEWEEADKKQEKNTTVFRGSFHYHQHNVVIYNFIIMLDRFILFLVGMA